MTLCCILLYCSSLPGQLSLAIRKARKPAWWFVRTVRPTYRLHNVYVHLVITCKADMLAFLFTWFYFGNRKWELRVWGLSYLVTECGQWYAQVWSWLIATLTHWTTLAYMYQSGSHSSSASWCSTVCTTKHPSTSSTSASLTPVSPLDNIFALPAEVFSLYLAIVSAVMVGGLLWLPLWYGTGY